jgi:apolipoprotein N-acyltransferase
VNKIFLHRSLFSYWPFFSLIAGALTTLAFAPFDLSWLVFFTLAPVFYFWSRLTTKQAAISGWLYGLGLQCTGVSWIYHSLHTHGSAPAFFAVLLIFLLCSYLSIYTALAAYTVNRFLPDKPVLRLLLFYPASWVLFEWLQGYVMTGFAWMQLGYTQIDYPLSGFAPIFGSHAVSGIVAVCAGALVLLFTQGLFKQLLSKERRFTYRFSVMVVLPVLLLWLSGALLKTINWTEKAGDPVKVTVIQGNIAQKDKWKSQLKQPTLDLYRELSLAQQDVDLIIWPETAVPDYWYRVVPYIKQLRLDMKAKDADLLLGIFVKNDEKRLLNSVLSVQGGVYSKRHLVPLGEYIPLRFMIEFFNSWVKIPMSDIASGDEDQPLLTAAGVPLGISICFEEAFARDVIKDLPEAKLLINVSNDAWFEDSHEPHQHHAIGRMRALETGRYMIRSTNTGITSLIGPHGEVIRQLPQFETAVLNGEVQPLSGATPFVRWGNWLIVGLCVLLLLGFAKVTVKALKNI